MNAAPGREELLARWESEQSRLRRLLVLVDTESWQKSPDFSGLQRVGGVDLSFIKGDDVSACVQLVVLSYPHLDVMFVDGNGVFHCREFGLACHFGVLSGLPCVGVAKNLLHVDGVKKDCEHQSQIAALQRGGDSFPLTTASGKVLGKALRSSDQSRKPVYVSAGHRISLDAAVRLTHSCCRYRVPEPIRQADCRSREFLRTHYPA